MDTLNKEKEQIEELKDGIKKLKLDEPATQIIKKLITHHEQLFDILNEANDVIKNQETEIETLHEKLDTSVKLTWASLGLFILLAITLLIFVYVF